MRGYVLSIWSLLDPIYFHCSRLTFPPRVGTENSILRIRITKYKGRNTTLSDGTTIQKNDLMVKIHLHNVKLLKELKEIKSEIKKGKMIYRYVQKSLPGVEAYIRNSPYANEIKGIIGITLLSKGCERLGFEIIEITHPIYKWFKRMAFLPIGILSSPKSSIWQMLKEQCPHYLMMSTNKLSDMYKVK